MRTLFAARSGRINFRKSKKPYTYPQPSKPKSATSPGSHFGRHAGSVLHRRRQFSAIASKTSLWANGSGEVSYANANVIVSSGGQNLAVSGKQANYEGYGMPNSLQWKVAGLQSNTDYQVSISGVSVNGVSRQYQYSFRLQ